MKLLYAFMLCKMISWQNSKSICKCMLLITQIVLLCMKKKTKKNICLWYILSPCHTIFMLFAMNKKHYYSTQRETWFLFSFSFFCLLVIECKNTNNNGNYDFHFNCALHVTHIKWILCVTVWIYEGQGYLNRIRMHSCVYFPLHASKIWYAQETTIAKTNGLWLKAKHCNSIEITSHVEIFLLLFFFFIYLFYILCTSQDNEI